MIFKECDNGLKIEILHEELMDEDIVRFILTILEGRKIYRGHYADLDDDNPDGE